MKQKNVLFSRTNLFLVGTLNDYVNKNNNDDRPSPHYLKSLFQSNYLVPVVSNKNTFTFTH